ncbi:hypothetical protein FISHEDRAFT_38455 [Fistulina hepatica ATCC 64428]|nr:hypothetical protein FISHEDRAFT_38455 [Fistulina hepatica ATCC 64428]
MATPTYNLFFTGKDDPRRCVIIGEDTKPHLFCFETTERLMSTKTTVQKDNRDIVAQLDWSPGNHLGSVTLHHRRYAMSQMVLPGAHSNSRIFVSSSGKQFEWRRNSVDPRGYELYSGPVQIASFRRYSEQTAVGPAHGLLQYTFDHDSLLTEALLALCINRHLDSHMGAI